MVVPVQVPVPVLVLRHILALVVEHVCFNTISRFNLRFASIVIAVCSPACSNGGTCGSPNTCTCPSTYSGTTCTIRKSRSCFIVNLSILLYLAVCSPVCSNGGTCSSPGTCTCPSTYTGTRCATRRFQHNF